MEDRLAALARRLRGLEHDALARVPAEPWLHVKRVLAEHADDDARSAGALEDLCDAAAGTEPVAPEDRQGVQGELAREARELLATATGEPLMTALVALALRQERHADELPRRRPSPLPLQPPLLADDPPGPIDEAIAAGEDAARAGDAAAAAAHLRRAAELDAERTRAGEPFGAPR